VKGLDPRGGLADQAERIIRVRLDELVAFTPRALDPVEVQALHDMRIAAKRLRYVLEVFADLYGPYAQRAAKRTKDLQDLIGEIHDCDVMLPRIHGLIDELEVDAARAVRSAAGDAADLDPAVTAGAPHAERWRGLHTLAMHLAARRALLFERFLELWTELGREGFVARLDFALHERA
jgi:CHAD domain-containing protein